MKFTPSKLFHAVVITGAALTGCAGQAQKPTAPSEPSAASSEPGSSDAARSAPTAGTQGVDTQCPPGSERPYPPCYWIK